MSRRLPVRHRRSLGSHRRAAIFQARPDGEAPDGRMTGRHCLGAAALALNTGDDRAAERLLELARGFIAQARAEVALAREEIRLTAETRIARRDAKMEWYKAVGASVEEVEFDLQIEEDAERIRRARQAGGPVPEPRWEASWELVGGRRDDEPLIEGWDAFRATLSSAEGQGPD